MTTRIPFFLCLLLALSCSVNDQAQQVTPLTQSPTMAKETRPSTESAVTDSLQKVLSRIAGPEPYIVIDRTRNALSVRSSDEIMLDATCATGSGKILFGEKKNETWHFKTPKRVFKVGKKVKNPIWKKPVWAFVEKNEKAPALPWEFSRLDGTTLGDFALELEDSYAIHGTLYPNLLGRSITHGCVRLNAEDLATAYRIADVGTKVFVF